MLLLAPRLFQDQNYEICLSFYNLFVSIYSFFSFILISFHSKYKKVNLFSQNQSKLEKSVNLTFLSIKTKHFHLPIRTLQFTCNGIKLCQRKMEEICENVSLHLHFKLDLDKLLSIGRNPTKRKKERDRDDFSGCLTRCNWFQFTVQFINCRSWENWMEN